MLDRFFRHLLHAYGQAQRRFPPRTRQKIADAVARAEQGHAGEICVVVEASLTPLQLLRGMSARERALEVFAQQRVWDTAHNSGVLVYLLLADHAVEIVADRGLHPHGEQCWPQAIDHVRQAFASDDPADGCIAAIEAIGHFLRDRFPSQGPEADELPNPVRIL